MTDADMAAGATDVQAVIDRVVFDSRGLIPVIIQEEGSRDVLMLGYMDDEAIRRTLTEGRVTFWSRSRKEYRRKGDTSGNRQYVRGAALDWAREAITRGVGELLVNSIDADGTRRGFDLELIALMREVSTVPVIASGGAGSIDDFAPAIAAGADAVLAASVFHDGELTVGDVKRALAAAGVRTR